MKRPTGGSPDASPAVVADEVHRLAVLLEAGLPPGRAWAHAAPTAGDDEPAHVSMAEIGDRIDARGDAWHEVAVAWRVAATVGAPLAPSLRATAEALRDAARARDDIAVALAEPATTARLIGWLPVLGVVLVVAFGFDMAAVAATPAGAICIAAGVGLMFAARRWTARLVRSAEPEPGVPGWTSELVAVALAGGVSIDRALAVVEAAGAVGAAEATSATLGLSRTTGAPAVDLLRADAAERRRAARTEGRMRAARLSGRLLVPLGACTLPAFLLLGVAPMLLAVLAGAPVEL